MTEAQKEILKLWDQRQDTQSMAKALKKPEYEIERHLHLHRALDAKRAVGRH